MENVQLAGKTGFADQEAVGQFLEDPLSVIQKRGHVEEQVFSTDETGLFYKDIDRLICLNLVDKNILTRRLQEPNPVFPLGAIVQYLVFSTTL